MIRAAIILILGIMAAPTYADIVSATYSDPTDLYKHGVLGDAVEYRTLKIATNNTSDQNSKSLSKKLIVKEALYEFKLPIDHVFEDTIPRLSDVDGDGKLEVIVIETDVNKGAALAVYDETGKLAETPHIGTSHRWLAPIGTADFDGDGTIDIAYIDRPHLAKMLRIVSFQDGKLTEIAQRKGLTNHKIGWDYIASGVRTCNGFSEIITANTNWSHVMATRMIKGRVVSERLSSYKDPSSIAAALLCKD